MFATLLHSMQLTSRFSIFSKYDPFSE